MKGITLTATILVLLGCSCRKSLQTAIVETNSLDIYCHFQEDSTSILDLHIPNTTTYRRTDSSLIFSTSVGKDTFFWLEMNTRSLRDGRKYTLVSPSVQKYASDIPGRIYLTKRYWGQPYDSATFGLQYDSLPIYFIDRTEKYNYSDQDSAISFRFQGYLICQSCIASWYRDSTEPVIISGAIWATEGKP